MNNLLGSNIKISLRKMLKDKYYSFINIFGLALGIAGSFVIGSWVWQELNYDAHYQDSDRIYRISVGFYNSGAFARGPEILNNILNEQAPEVEYTTRVYKHKPNTIYIADQTFEANPLFVDSAFFRVFNHKFIQGNPENALSSLSNVILTAKLATRLFGTTDVLGKTLLFGKDKSLYQISGVIEENPNPTHLTTEMWMPMKLNDSDNWTSAQCFNYVKLNDNANKSQLENRLEEIRKNLVYPEFNSPVEYNEWKNLGMFDFYVKPLRNIHLDPTMKFDLQAGGNRINVYVFLMISIFLMVIAIINFVNLSTAQSTKRAKEVGVRKVMGTTRSSLIYQFIVESVVISMIAMLVGVGLAEIFLILFQSFTNEVLINGLFSNWLYVVVFISFGLIIGVVAGLYPAIYLSRFKPIDVFKFNLASGKGLFRNILVVFQFTISIALIICSILVYQQLQYLRLADLGFDRDNVLVIKNVTHLGDKMESFKQKVLQHSGVQSASYNKRTPAGSSIWLYTLQSKSMEQGEGFQTFIGDDQYLQTVGFRLIEGRNFSKDIASDSTAVILTQSAAKALMLKDEIVGAQLDEGFHVIGVVADFSYQGFTGMSDPAIIMYDPKGYRLAVRLSGSQTSDFIAYINDLWMSMSIDQPIDYSFVDDNFEKLLVKEKTLGKTITFFTSIAIFISCLGLFGLAAFTTEQRQKEIGIRKVLGASVKSVVLLLNRSFSQLVLIAVALSIPIAWYLMDLWLQNFEYKMEINYLVFIISGLVALVVAWLTVSYLSISAAVANPVDTLKDE